MTTTSALALLLEQRAHGGAHVAGVEARVVDAVGAWRSGSRRRPRARTHLDAHHLAGVQRQGQRDRADPAVEVEHPLAAGQAGRVERGARRGARPSPCWSGRRRRARSRSAAVCRGSRAPRPAARRPLSWRVLPSRVVSATPAACGPEHASASSAAANSSLGEGALAGDQPGLELARAPPLAHHEVAQEAAVVAPVVGRQPLLAAPGQHRRAQRVDALGGQDVVLDVSIRSQRPGVVEAQHQLAASSSPNEYSSLLR